MRKIQLALCISVLLLMSCAAKTLTPEGLKVRTMKSDPSFSCEEISTVSGSATFDDVAKIIMRNEAGKLGANFIRLETAMRHGSLVTYTGTAFKCPEE